MGKSYRHRLEILKGIDLTVERGEILGLIGPTGSGKTTLLRLINLLEEPSAREHPLRRQRGFRKAGEGEACRTPQNGHGLSKAGHVQGQRAGECLLWPEDAGKR